MSARSSSSSNDASDEDEGYDIDDDEDVDEDGPGRVWRGYGMGISTVYVAGGVIGVVPGCLAQWVYLLM
jgi:hypothetical protein